MMPTSQTSKKDPMYEAPSISTHNRYLMSVNSLVSYPEGYTHCLEYNKESELFVEWMSFFSNSYESTYVNNNLPTFPYHIFENAMRECKMPYGI